MELVYKIWPALSGLSWRALRTWCTKKCRTWPQHCRSDDVPIECALANRFHHILREPLALLVPCSNLPREKIPQGASDNSPNMEELVLFGDRFVLHARHYLLEQLVRGRPCRKLTQKFGRDLLHPRFVGDNLQPLVPSRDVFLDRRFSLLVGCVVAQLNVSFLSRLR